MALCDSNIQLAINIFVHIIYFINQETKEKMHQVCLDAGSLKWCTQQLAIHAKLKESNQ